MIIIRQTNATDRDFQKLVLLLDKYLDETDRTAHCICVPFNNTETIKHAVVAYSADTPAGCGSIREYSPDTMEIKRMFVQDIQRRKGIASIILDELENWAKELGFTRCILERGEKLPDAINFYRKKDYSRIANYGQYECIGSSVCFEKNI